MYAVDYNPVQLIGKLKEGKRNYDVWDVAEFRQFLEAIDNIKYITAFKLLYMTGLRRGEFLALKWSDLEGNILHITKGCNYEKGGYVITSPKTENSIRDVMLDVNTLEQLLKYKKEASKLDGWTEDYFMFGHIHPMSFNALSEAKNRYVKKSGVKNIRIHDFRHSHVSLLINNNIALPAIAKRIGDDMRTVISTYAHLFEKSDNELIHFLNGQYLG